MTLLVKENAVLALLTCFLFLLLRQSGRRSCNRRRAHHTGDFQTSEGTFHMNSSSETVTNFFFPSKSQNSGMISTNQAHFGDPSLRKSASFVLPSLTSSPTRSAGRFNKHDLLHSLTYDHGVAIERPASPRNC